MTNNLIMEDDGFLSCSTRGGHKTLYDVAKNSSCRRSLENGSKTSCMELSKQGLAHTIYSCVTNLQTLGLF